MEAAQAREVRWHPVPFWGMGWTVGAIALGIAAWLFEEKRAVWLSFLLLPTAGIAAFGLPTVIGAFRTGSRAPWAQAFIWVVGFTIAGVLLMNTFGDQHRLAEPGDLNINTSETILQRQASFDKWGRSPEEMASFFFSVAVIITFAVAAGILSAIVGTQAAALHKWLAIPLFGLAAALGIVVGLWVGAVLASIFLPFAGFAAGCTAGAITERARSTLLSTD
jgi:hypothetical protein